MTDKFYEESGTDDLENPKTSISGFWSEKVYILTEDFEITGFVFMPKTGRKNRVLSDILNGKRRFVAVKDAVINCRKKQDISSETSDFIQLNLDSIIMIRPMFQ